MKLTELANKHIKSSGLLEIPEFFVGSEPKIHEIIQKVIPPPKKRALFGGGGIFIKCRFPQVSLKGGGFFWVGLMCGLAHLAHGIGIS